MTMRSVPLGIWKKCDNDNEEGSVGHIWSWVEFVSERSCCDEGWVMEAAYMSVSKQDIR